MSDTVVDSSPSADDSHIRIAIGHDTSAALDALIEDVDALTQADGAMRPIPRRPTLIEEAIRSQVRRHRALRAQGQPVPVPAKNVGPYRLGNVPRHLHALLVGEQAQLKAEHPGHTVALPDIVEAGLRGVIQRYRQMLAEVDHTLVHPTSAPEARSKIDMWMGTASLEALDAYIRRLEEQADARDDLAEPVPSRQELLEEAIRAQILHHRRLRAQGQPVPIPLRAAGPFERVKLARPLHAALRAEQGIFQADHQDELEYTISLRDIAEVGVDALLPADLRRRPTPPVRSVTSPQTNPSPPRWHYLNPKLLLDTEVEHALERLAANQAPGSPAPTVRELVEQALQQFFTQRQHHQADLLPLDQRRRHQSEETTVRITRELMTTLQREARRHTSVPGQRVTVKQVARAILTRYLAGQGILLGEPGGAADRGH